MNQSPSIYIFTEDKLSLAVARKMAMSLGFVIAHSNEVGGNAPLKTRIRKYNEIAGRMPVLILTDLDAKECAPDLLGEWTQTFIRDDRLLLRIIVREVESWLFADTKSFAAYIGVEVSNLPRNPEGVADPKQELFNLIRRKSKKRQIKEGILPINNSRLGPEYNSLLTEFVRSSFDLNRAAEKSDSLARALRALESVKQSHL